MQHHNGRPLGAGERFFYLADQWVPKHFVLAAEIQGVTTIKQWRSALDQLQSRHPLMRTRIVRDDNGDVRFEEGACAKIPLHVVDRRDERNWEQHVADELAVPFSFVNAPLVRARLLRQPEGTTTVVLVFHHSIADGLAGIYALGDLLKALAGGELEPLPLLPSQEKLLKPLVEIPREAAASALPSWPSRSVVNTAIHRISVQSKKLPGILTESLRARSRAEGTTLHGTLVAALTLAGSELSEQWKRTPPRVMSPVNLRPMLQINDECMLSIIFPIGTYPIEGVEGFWSVARQAVRDLEPAKIPHVVEQVFKAVADLTAPPAEPAQVGGFIESVIAAHMMVSNLGAVPFPAERNQLRVTAVWGPATLIGTEGEQIIGVATLNNELHLVQSSYTPIIGLLDRTADILNIMSQPVC
ncbi:condensation domain-containing protein [Acidipila sp. EB88]|uniref:condensation domain-containing protein n=1 Tax=Acidipila sp. EB88 TaxID=2305226 RepID=UPI00131563E8|nr:condensation domain-containing protein [Acidipila sp. EB88]